MWNLRKLDRPSTIDHRQFKGYNESPTKVYELYEFYEIYDDRPFPISCGSMICCRSKGCCRNWVTVAFWWCNKINMVAVRISGILEAKIDWNYFNLVLIFSPFFSAISLVAVHLGRSFPFLYRCMLEANYKDLGQWNQSMIISICVQTWS